MASPASVQHEVTEPLEPLPEVTLLVCLPPRWQELPGDLYAALQPRVDPLDFEREIGSISRRWLATSALVHVLVLATVIWIVPTLPLYMPVVIENRPQKSSAVYYQPPSLPQMEDARPSPAVSARHPGRHPATEAYHPTQTIRISRGSVIRTKVVDAPDPALPKVKGSTANLLAIAQMRQTFLPQLQAPPKPVELRNVPSTIARRSAQEPEVAADLSRLNSSVRALPRLPSSPAPQVRQQKPNPPAIQTSAGANKEAPMVSVSVDPGDAIAIPLEGMPGSLSMSPLGKRVSDSNESKSPAVTNADGSGSTGLHGTNGGPSPDAKAGDTSGTSPHPADSGSRTAAIASGSVPTRVPNLSPGVTVHGGVVSLESFGSRPAAAPAGVVNLGSFGPKAPALNTRTAAVNPPDPPRKPAPIVVVATGRSGGGLSTYNTFKSNFVYTIYFPTSAGMATMQFAEHAPSPGFAGELTPPDPISTPAGWKDTRPAAILLSCELDSSGHVQNLRVLESASQQSADVIEAVRTWRFHPALSAGRPVAVDALIGIGVGRR
jgi:TonB-like protein